MTTRLHKIGDNYIDVTHHNHKVTSDWIFVKITSPLSIDDNSGAVVPPQTIMLTSKTQVHELVEYLSGILSTINQQI